MILFAKVEASFAVAKHGCVVILAPDESKWPNADQRLKSKDPIQLRRPDGQILDTYIEGFEMASATGAKGRIVVRLPESVTKSDVPAGTQIWIST